MKNSFHQPLFEKDLLRLRKEAESITDSRERTLFAAFIDTIEKATPPDYRVLRGYVRDMRSPEFKKRLSSLANVVNTNIKNASFGLTKENF